MAAVNYAESYERALAQAYPNVLNFGELYNVSNNQVYKFVDSKTIHIPSISTTGRKNVNRDAIDGNFQRNVDNSFETKTLTFYREWSTSIDPADVLDTNMILTIQNATKVFNEEQKFPEKDAYTISKIYADWTAEGKTADTTALTVDNILIVFDKLMEAMDEALVPSTGRLLYVTPAVKTLLKQASNIGLSRDVNSNQHKIDRVVNRLDEVKLISVPSFLMKTAYDFTTGFEPSASAKQINLFLVHPSAILTPNKYAFVGMEAPAAGTKGDYIYYEKEYADVFILNNRTGAIAFNVAE
ncbi:MAG: capsid protein [Bacilli bacterium]|nr:capsid protein [Bacilli bacterium]